MKVLFIIASILIAVLIFIIIMLMHRNVSLEKDVLYYKKEYNKEYAKNKNKSTKHKYNKFKYK